MFLLCSIAELESEPGLFLSNKEVFNYYFFINKVLQLKSDCYSEMFVSFLCEQRVFVEADMMAKKYREKLPHAFITKGSEPLSKSAFPFENQALYANWKWFKFEK